jgi:tetratricopeptide (TPR) repeat protein
VTGRLIRFPRVPLSSDAGIRAAERVLATPLDERRQKAAALHLEDPETLLALCGFLRERLTTSPASVRSEAEFLYRFIESPKREVGLFDERDYFLGETALLAGTACRFLSEREEAWLWFDRAEAGFRHTMNAVGELSRLAYQRLAERLEERQFDVVLELLPSLVESFQKLGMPEDALKCRFLEGLAHMERDEPAASIRTFREVCEEARRIGSEKLLAEAHCNLVQAHAMLGEAEAAVAESRRAVPILQRLGDRIALAKVQWGIGMLLRESGHIAEAIEAYGQARAEFETIGMRADVAAVNLVIADLLLEGGATAEALRAVSRALPVISELKMAPEGMAALALVRESARRQEIDRQALRELHGYFQQLGS